MPFNVEKFTETQFVDNTKEIELEDLKDFFDKDEKPVFKVRGLNLNEVVKAQNEHDNQSQATLFLNQLSNNQEDLKEIKKMVLGNSTDLEAHTIKMISYLEYGIIEPKFERTQIVLFCERFPVESFQIYNDIVELTGAGKKKQN